MGTVYKRRLKDGGISWQGVVRQKKRGQEPIHVSAAFPTKEEAEKYVKEMEARLRLGLLKKETAADRTTFTEAAERYRKEIVPQKRSAEQENRRLDFILKHFPARNTFLSAISPADIAKYRDKRLKEVSNTSVVHELALISRIFSTCIKDFGFITLTNPVSLIRKPKFNPARDRRVSNEELSRILSATKNTELTVIAQLAVETAMREGEICGVEWDNVDLKKRTITLPLTKNGEKRVVPLSQKAVSLLSGLVRPVSGGHVFSMEKQRVSIAFRRAVVSARKKYEQECNETKETPDPHLLIGIHFHDLRHEATSRFVEGGLSISEIAAITGHKTFSMLKRYSHPSPEHLVARISAMAERA